MNDYKDWMISVDDHVIEPPDLWERHITPKYRDAAPKVVCNDGLWQWELEGKRKVITGLVAVAGTPSTEWDPMPMNLGNPPAAGSGDPKVRLAAMDQDHIIASLIFPTFANSCGQTFLDTADNDLALACIRAYNDWMIDHAFVVVPLQQIAGKFLMSMKDYPPSQSPGSFNLDKIQKQIEAAGAGH